MKKIVFLVLIWVLSLGTKGFGQSCPTFPFPNQTSASCNNPVSNYIIKRSVVFIQFGNTVGTGFLISTTSPNSNDVYLLTASHVLKTTLEAQSSLFLFGYEGNVDTAIYALRGSAINAEVVASETLLDFTLIRLSRARLPLCYKALYSGWDISNDIPNGTYGIHHPIGDDKKISFSNRSPLTITGTNFSTGTSYLSNTHWKVIWSNGVTQPGSSGSPIFDSYSNRSIGIASSNKYNCGKDLSGNYIVCPILSFPCLEYTAYQKLSATWEGFSADSRQLKHWLDPDTSNVLKLDGYDPHNLQWTAANSYEPNNSTSAAESVFTRISSGFKGFLKSYLQTSTDKDYFKIKVKGNGRLKLTLKDKPQNCNLKIIIAGGTEFDLRSSSTSDEIEIYDKSDIYFEDVYAVIENNSGTSSTTPYKLQVEFLACTDTYEDNDTRYNANTTAFYVLQSAAQNRTITSYIGDNTDEDWYVIQADVRGTINLTLSSLPFGYKMELRTANSNNPLLLASSTSTGATTASLSYIQAITESTQYFIRIYSPTHESSLCDGYNLNLNWQAGITCTAPTPSVSTTAESAAGARDGAIRLTLSGGTTPYTFSWNNGATTQNLSNLSGGRYTVTITTADGCRTTSTANVPTTGSIAPYCDAITNLTSNSATFSDGSGTDDYAPFSDCRWLIQPTNAQNITLNFTAFTLGTNDTVFVYDGNSAAAPLLGKFSSSLTPLPLVSSGGSLYIRFMTNATSQAAGWTARYTTSLIQETEKLVGYEYWFDNNENNRIARFFTPIASRSLDVRLNTEGLSYGLHTIHFRTKDENGVYSSVVSQFFTKEKPKEATAEMVYWEYWYDENYNDRIVEGFPYGENMIIDDYILPPDSLRVGLHTLHARFQDINSEWSSVISRFFYKSTPSVSDNKIKSYRFWFDDAPQNMQTKVVSPPSDVVALDSLLNVSALGVGRHLIHFQHQDLNNVWSSVVTDTFFLYLQPTARFTYQNVNCTNGQVQFNNNSTEATSYLWLFPNGVTSTLAAPIYTFPNTGNFDVTLVAINAGGFRDSTTQQITVTNTVVSAAITPISNVIICQRDTVTLTASGGTNYLWSNGQNTSSIRVSQSGNYLVTVTNGSGCISTASRIVTVISRPNVNFSFTIQGGRVTFTNLSTGATSYNWQFANDSTSTATNPTTNYRANGNYRVCLTANNSQNCPDSTCKDVNITRVAVQELPENLKVQISPNPTSGIINVLFYFEQTFSFEDKLYLVDLLGKQVADFKELRTANNLDISHLANGTYLVKLNLGNQIYTLGKVIKSD